MSFGSTYVVHLLVGKGAVVLENVVVLGTSGIDNLLQDGLQGDHLSAKDGHRDTKKVCRLGDEPGSRSVGRREYQRALRHGTWE